MATTIAAQIALVRSELETRPAGLVRHVGRVLGEALALGAVYDLDPERVELAAWGHDLFRAHAPAEQLRLAAEAGITVLAEDVAAPVLLHGPVAAAVLRERFGVDDEEALAAVETHTFAAAEMSLLAKVILIADKVEKRKRGRTPVMADIRRVARRDLDLALLCWSDWKWVQERENSWHGSARHWAARVLWVAEHHAEIELPPRLT